MIEVEHLTKVYRLGDKEVVALQDVTLTVPQGQIYGVIGLSGAGKSTLIRCINMLERPDYGKIRIGGVEITSLRGKTLREQRRKIGMIFQHFNLLWSRTVFGNVAFPLEIAGVPRAEIRERVNELLDLVGLRDKADAYPAQLSGGQKQRVGIARALANRPAVLLSDEATSALDPQTTKSILQLLRDINARLGLTILLITHEMNVIKEVCDQVAVIEHGRIVESGPVLEVFTNPQTETARNFLKGITVLDLPEAVRKRSITLERPGLAAKILSISFLGESAGEPVISTLVRQFNVDANILYGNIDQIHDIPFGTLVVELIGTKNSLEKALAYLKGRRLKVEVLEDVAASDVDAAVGGLA